MIVPSQGVVNFCNWLQNTPYALAIAGSTWAYPFVQTTHFTGLSIWLGTSLAVDFRLVGWVGKGRNAGEFARSLFAWNWIGFVIAVIGGASLFSTDAVAFSRNPAVQLKLLLFFPVALILHVIVQRKAIHSWGADNTVPATGKIAGLAEFLLWLSVASAAANIPYFEKFL
jgi:hypothetical protein